MKKSQTRKQVAGRPLVKQTLRIGDVVALKSGGSLRMTIVDIEPDNPAGRMVEVAWCAFERLEARYFPMEALTRAPAPPLDDKAF